MPQFFFDVREGVRFAPDADGLDFPDLNTAEKEAAQAAAAIGRDLLPKGVARSVTVEVRSEHGQRVITATDTLARSRQARAKCAWPEGGEGLARAERTLDALGLQGTYARCTF